MMSKNLGFFVVIVSLRLFEKACSGNIVRRYCLNMISCNLINYNIRKYHKQKETLTVRE